MAQRRDVPLDAPIVSRPGAPAISAVGTSLVVHEWTGSGPPYVHIHHSDDEAWHVLEGTRRSTSERRSRPSSQPANSCPAPTSKPSSTSATKFHTTKLSRRATPSRCPKGSSKTLGSWASASSDRVGWSTRNRPLLPASMILPGARSLPHGLAQLPEKLGDSGVAASRAW